jgi:RNA polymerase sigma-70 factor (ECF subfamily)
VHNERGRSDDPSDHERTENGDIASLVELLDPDVTLRTDGGGLVPASRKVFTGAERVARIFTRMARHFAERMRITPITVNGAPGLLMETNGSPGVVTFTLDRGRITAIDSVRNPEKLGMLSDASMTRDG